MRLLLLTDVGMSSVPIRYIIPDLVSRLTGDQGSFSGHAGQELHCITASFNTVHNVKLSDIESNGRKLILDHNADPFVIPTCTDDTVIATITKDGCSVVPGDVSIYDSTINTCCSF